MSDEQDHEREELSRDNGKTLAKKHEHATDPFTDIPPSLLSAEHIDQYIKATGLIAPYFRGGKKDRLKRASYEGRIGSKAYEFAEDGRLKSKDLSDGFLVVPANSIVFVESHLDFYLPRYIALRYNLQIRHVHRGLLLGTGPLVDPGYWGKLCIPLHNLTSQEYAIPINDGLIWIEFTKTTSDSPAGRDPLVGEAADHERGHWKIEKFIRKAAEPMNDGAAVAIRSSIPTAVLEATTAANNAERISGDAERKAENARTLLRNIGAGAALAGFVAIAGVWGTFYFGLRDHYLSLDARIDSLFAPPQAESEQRWDSPATAASIEAMEEEFEAMEEELRGLRIENQRLRQSLDSVSDPAAVDGSIAE